MKSKEWNKNRKFANRLLALAKFLKTKVPKNKFDFSIIMGFEDDIAMNEDTSKLVCGLLNKTKKYDCGTVGCAIGWMPNCFPKDMHFVERYGAITVALKSDSSLQNFSAAKEYFGLTYPEVEMLFTPDNGLSLDWNKHNCGEDATAAQVGKMIEAFVKDKKAGVFDKFDENGYYETEEQEEDEYSSIDW